MSKDRIKWLQRTCGTYATARHLHNNGVPLRVALAWLANGGQHV